MATKVISLRIEDDLLEKVDAAAGKKRRNQWCIQAFRNELNDDGRDKPSAKETIVKQESERQMDELLDNHLLNVMRDRNVLENLSDAELAKMIAQRAPKHKNADEELTREALSLTNSLKLLPETDNICAELSKAKHEVEKLKHEKIMQAAVMDALRKKLMKQDKEAAEAFIKACQEMENRCNAFARHGGIRGIDFEDLKAGI